MDTIKILDNKEIENILTLVLGENATGIYCDTTEIEGDGYEEFYSEVSDEGFRHLIEETDDIYVASGVTRVVLIPRDKDYVIKLPIMATYEWFSHLERFNKNLNKMMYEDVPEGGWEEEEMTDPNYYDNEQKGPWKKVATSFMMRYKKNERADLMAQENSYLDYSPELAKLLLPNVFHGYWHGIPIYTQKKVAHVDGHSMWGKGSSSKMTKLCDNYHDVTGARIPSYQFFEAIYKNYGADFTRKVLFDIRETNIDSDLHGNNVGYLEDDTPVIFDYAGYDKDWIYLDV